MKQNIAPKKSFGQHYLKDPSIVDLIVQQFQGRYSKIVEVGPGMGALTKKLSLLGAPFIVIEKDPRFEENLKEMEGISEVCMQDALSYNFRSLGEDLWLVSNLPYNVSTILFIGFLQNPNIKFMTLMFQKEVGEKLVTDDPHAMNSLKVLAQTFFQTTVLKKVLPGAFLPPPKVDSLIINFERKSDTLVPLKSFHTLEIFLRKLFMQRRKQIYNVLSQNYDKGLVERALKEADVQKTLRAHALSLRQVLSLYGILKS